MRRRALGILSLILLATSLGLAACGDRTPLQPVNRSPVVQSLVAFPSAIGPGDSAIVVCVATDPNGDTLRYDWYAYGPLDWRWRRYSGYADINDPSNSFVVYPGASARSPVDTGWVRCEVRDLRGGGTYAGMVQIVLTK